MNATIGVMSKRLNSTKQSFSGTAHACVMKDPQSRETPTFLVTGAPMQHSNYMSFNGWYYWIDDIISETNNMYRIRAHVDPLATWKSAIAGTSAFVNFGPKSHWNNQILDPRLRPDQIEYTNLGTQAFDCFDYSSGCVIMRVLSLDGGAGEGGIQTICGSMASFKAVLDDYATGLDTDLSNMQTDFEKLMGKMAGLGNALDAIVSAVWIPFKLSDISSGTGAFANIGGYNLSGTWYWPNIWAGALMEEHSILIIPGTIVTDYKFLAHPTYMNVQLVTPGGTFDISDPIFTNYSAPEITARLCYTIDGDCTLYVREKNSKLLLATSSWNASIDLKNFVYKAPSVLEAGVKAGLKIGSMAIGLMSVGGAVASSTGTLMAEAGVARGSERMMNAGLGLSSMGEGMNISNKALSAGISAAYMGIDANVGVKQCGAPSNLSNIYVNDSKDTINIIQVLFDPKVIEDGQYENFCDRYGYPNFTYETLSGGFYQCAGASVIADAPEAELATINSFCNSGIYVE